MRSVTRLAMLDGWPIQIGVAITRMSASITCLRNAGHSSPLPSSAVTPGLTSWSTTRADDVATPWLAIALSNRSSIFWVEEAVGDGVSVQLRPKALGDMGLSGKQD